MESIIPFKNNALFKLCKKVGYDYFKRKYLSLFFKNIEFPVANKAKGKILIYAGIGNMYLTPMEVLIYHLLRKEGYEVAYYIYDQNVPINEIITEAVIKKTGKDIFWKRSIVDAEHFLKSSHVKYNFIDFPSSLDNIISPVKDDLDKVLTFNHDGIHFGEIVKGVMYRFYKSLSFGEDALLRANQFLKTSLANYFQVKQLCETSNYQYLFFSHGIYCTWEPVTAYCKKNNIPFICYDRAKRNASANFNLNQPSPDWNFDNAWERYNEKQLNMEEEKMVDQYVKERELQKDDVYSYNSTGRIRDINSVKQLLGIKQQARILTIFTNLVWDAANVARDIAFSSALDCIEQTINYFKDIDDVHILIRCHPAEKILGTQERYGNLIRKKFNDQLPGNVTIIEPEMNINSFTVIDVSDIGVVHTSTVGLEFAMAAKPIVLISETHYRNKGFTYDATSTEDYFSKINLLLGQNMDQMILTNQVKLARKYFYMMMFLYQKNMPVKYKNNCFNGYTINSIHELQNSDPLYQVINSLGRERKDFIFWE